MKSSVGYTQEFFDQLGAIMHRGGGIRLVNEDGKLINAMVLTDFAPDTYAALKADGYLNPVKVHSLLQSTINGVVYVSLDNKGERECVFDVIGPLSEIERLQDQYEIEKFLEEHDKAKVVPK